MTRPLPTPPAPPKDAEMRRLLCSLALPGLVAAPLLSAVPTLAQEHALPMYVEPFNGRFQPPPDAASMDHVLLNLIALHPQALDDDDFLIGFAVRNLCQHIGGFFGDEFSTPRSFAEFRATYRDQILQMAQSARRSYVLREKSELHTYDVSRQGFVVTSQVWFPEGSPPNILRIDGAPNGPPRCARDMFAHRGAAGPSGNYAGVMVQLDRPIQQFFLPLPADNARDLVARFGRTMDVEIGLDITGFAGFTQGAPKQAMLTGRVTFVRLYNTNQHFHDPRPLLDQ
jgi:hypothetical protein